MEGRENCGFFDFDFFEKLHQKNHFCESSAAEKFTAAETKFSLRQNCHKNGFLGDKIEIEESAVFTPFHFLSAFRWYPRIVYPTNKAQRILGGRSTQRNGRTSLQ